MAQEINLGGTIYVSSKRAAEMTGYTQDYIGQLARAGNITAQRVSGLWYVVEESLRNYKAKADEFKPTPPSPHTRVERQMESAISFDGKDYVSAQRAADITGYHPDYVGQLARTGKILSRQVGNRWFVDRESVVEHKKHNDALLAAVQAESVGLMRHEEVVQAPSGESLHFTYTEAEKPSELISEIIAVNTSAPIVEEPESEESITEIPIRVIKSASDRNLGAISPRAGRRYFVSMASGVTLMLLIGIPAVGGVYYAYTSKSTTPSAVTAKLSTVSQFASTALPAVTSPSSIELPEFLANVAANTLYYRRDSF